MSRSLQLVSAFILITTLPALWSSTSYGAEKQRKPAAQAAQPTKAQAPAAAQAEPPSPSELGVGERVNVESIKEKYWARGNETELGVVQNRTYSKANKFELGVFGSFVSADPFLNIKSYGLSFGYHFNEYWALNLFMMKYAVNYSSAAELFIEKWGLAPNTNAPKMTFGGEVAYSPIYGKLSLLGKKIIYYDLHVLGGVGQSQTANGNYITEHFGIGQQAYLAKWMSFRIDYRAMVYKEDIIEHIILSQDGQNLGQRLNWNHSISFGFTFLFDFKKESAPK